MFGLMKVSTHDKLYKNLIRDKNEDLDDKETAMIAKSKECNEALGKAVWAKAEVKEKNGIISRGTKDNERLIKRVNELKKTGFEQATEIGTLTTRLDSALVELKAANRLTATYKGHYTRLKNG